MVSLAWAKSPSRGFSVLGARCSVLGARCSVLGARGYGIAVRGFALGDLLLGDLRAVVEIFCGQLVEADQSPLEGELVGFEG